MHDRDWLIQRIAEMIQNATTGMLETIYHFLL